jgi:DNA-directed RNA polymerase sigma subunit (sigma70/sigma32)
MSERRINLGIEVLHAIADKGARFSQQEIASFAGCSRSRIVQIEYDALKKLRRKLLDAADPLLRELASHFVR